MDTLVSRKPYLWPPSQNAIFLNSITNSVFFYIPIAASPSYEHLFRIPKVSAYKSFHFN